jgi:hypothetical protein
MLRLLDRCWPGAAVEEEHSSFNPIVERIEETSGLVQTVTSLEAGCGHVHSTSAYRARPLR